MPDLRSKNYAFAIDVSGTPYSDVYFGILAYDRNKFYELKREFSKKFPNYISKRQKSSNLNSTELDNIIRFLDSKDVKMGVTALCTIDWDKYRKCYPNKANFKEKIYALTYLRLLKSFVFPTYNYRVTMCNENYLGMTSVLDNLRRILKSNNFDIDIAIGHAKYNAEIKFADYVAGAPRKIKRQLLEEYDNYHIIENRPSKRDLGQVFK